jgi:5-methylcytosine-specific restriction protein A
VKTLKPSISILKTGVQVVQSGLSWRSQKTSSTERGYDHRWRKARGEYLRLHPLCTHCEDLGIFEQATVVDHTIPHRGNMDLFWDKSNWQSLCRACHDGWKAEVEAAADRAAGVIR